MPKTKKKIIVDKNRIFKAEHAIEVINDTIEDDLREHIDSIEDRIPLIAGGFTGKQYKAVLKASKNLRRALNSFEYLIDDLQREVDKRYEEKLKR